MRLGEHGWNGFVGPAVLLCTAPITLVESETREAPNNKNQSKRKQVTAWGYHAWDYVVSRTYFACSGGTYRYAKKNKDHHKIKKRSRARVRPECLRGLQPVDAAQGGEEVVIVDELPKSIAPGDRWSRAMRGSRNCVFLKANSPCNAQHPKLFFVDLRRLSFFVSI